MIGREVTICSPPTNIEPALKSSAAPMMGSGNASSAAPNFGKQAITRNHPAIA
jgi:hypothetical protein